MLLNHSRWKLRATTQWAAISKREPDKIQTLTTILILLLAVRCAASYIQCWPSCHLQMGQKLHLSLCHNTLFFLILPLFCSQWQSLDTIDLLTKQAENVSQSCQLAGQLRCLPPWARLQLRTGNLRVALVIQASHCLIPHKQTPTPPSLHSTPPPNTRTRNHHPTPCAFSPRLSSASSAVIGLTEARSPHLLVEIG